MRDPVDNRVSSAAFDADELFALELHLLLAHGAGQDLQQFGADFIFHSFSPSIQSFVFDKAFYTLL